MKNAIEMTSVAALPHGRLIRLRTPEGQEIVITPDRAIEWISDHKFIQRVYRAIEELPIPFKLKEDASHE